jgi:hypothetical protein
MNHVPPVPFERLTELSLVVDEQLGDRGQETRASAFSLCIEAISFGRETTPDHVGTQARSAAYLLLELAFPELDASVLHGLSAACERAAVGG